ncbi:MAG: T9SS type A sorting domain-containing protein [Bacteroidetes bacterium]|nr:T9SS type A sorting domain-containing protein [Bacteroidota bacterium]
MRKLIYISILLTFGFTSAFGQGLYRLAEGNEVNAVEMVTQSDNGLFIFEVTASSTYKLHTWNGFAYDDLGEIPNLPKHGDTKKEDFKIVDALYDNDVLYVLGHDFGPIKTNLPTRVLTWNGTDWKDITTNTVSSAHSATKLIKFNNKVSILGIFQSSGILSLNVGTWEEIGNRLGVNTQNDYVLDAAVYRGRIYATGEFTRPLSGQRYNTAIFENNAWRPVVTPPFIGKSKQFAMLNNELLLSGEANVEFDYLKSFDGIGWTNMSNGLENVLASEFWDMAVTDNQICLTGIFESRLTGVQFNYLIKDSDGWHLGEQSFSDVPMRLISNDNKIYAYGRFVYPGVQAIGEIGTHTAMLSGKIYTDDNDNCVLDDNETGLPMAKVTLNPGNLVTFTDDKGLYEFPVGPGAYTITFEPGVKDRYGCGRLATVTVGARVNCQVPDLNVVEKPNIVDLELSSQFRNGWKLVQGQYNEMQLNAFNNGSEAIEGATLQLKMGDWWQDVEITPTPTTIIDGEYTWNVTDLKKGERYTITISGTIKADLGLYNDFCFTGDVDFPQVDVAKNSNREAALLTTTDEIEPISKQVDCGRWYSSATENISYQIRFENESNETINNVTVLDTFDSELVTNHAWDYTDLGPSTKLDIKMVKVPGKEEWRLIYTWNSTDAGIAPAGDEDHKDVGYASLKFKLHEFSKQKGVELCNKAQVMLENSEPLSTNTVCSKATNLSVPGINLPSQVSFYPNPADQYVALNNSSNEKRTLEVLNQMGQVVYTHELEGFEQKRIDVSSFASGVYVLNVVGFEAQKLIIQ